MKILAIETSCDETAIAILDVEKKKKFSILSHAVASQIKIHEQFGGVFPMMAKREHAKAIVPLLLKALESAKMIQSGQTRIRKEKTIAQLLDREHELHDVFVRELSKIQKPDIDRIAVTVGPGLEPALWVGINFARALSILWNIPIIPVNHMEGHVLSIVVPKNTTEFSITPLKESFPAISLLVSGGHTEIVLAKKIGSYKVIGKTRDDAAGEAFDKVARMLGLPYPGGPEISKYAESFRHTGMQNDISLPRPMIGTPDFDFSFSGLKTAVLYMIKKIPELTDEIKKKIACEFEDAVCDVLIKKTLKASIKFKAKSIIVGGGVSANKQLAKRLTEESGIPVFFPSKELSTDNAVMIGIASAFGRKARVNSKRLKAKGNMEL